MIKRHEVKAAKRRRPYSVCARKETFVSNMGCKFSRGRELPMVVILHNAFRQCGRSECLQYLRDPSG